MSGSTQPSDLFTFVGGIFETAYTEHDLGTKLSATGAVLLVKCTEPDSEILLDMPHNKVYASAADSPVEANAVIKMDSDTADRFWQAR